MRSQYHLGQMPRLALDFLIDEGRRLDDEGRRLDDEEESGTSLDEVIS